VSCQLGKHNRRSFPSYVSQRALSLFALVHNISGPSHVKSNLGLQYLLFFFYDYSRCTWLFLIKNHSELFSIFQTFYNKIKYLFGVYVQILRSNNACEYLFCSFQNFMASNGILHQTSCAYTL